jgi:predicted dehydrogenase
MPEVLRLVALADPREARRSLVGDQVGLACADRHSDAMELLVRHDVEAVLIVTPPNLRPTLASTAVATGKHVLCEKPLAIAPALAADLVGKADRAGVQLGVVHNYLFLPEIRAVQDVIRSGEIGVVQVVCVDALGVLDNRGSAGGDYNWRHDPAVAGGGVLMDMLHLVYVAESLLGRPFESVSGYVDAFLPNSLVETVALCRFETDRNVALVNVGWGWGPGGLAVTGSKGRLEVRYRDGGTSPFSPLESVRLTDEAGSREIEVQAGQDPLGSVLKDFARSVRASRSPAANGQAGMRALEATVGAYQSAALGRSVRLPLQANEPVFSRGVAALADREIPGWTRIARKKLFGFGRADL